MSSTNPPQKLANRRIVHKHVVDSVYSPEDDWPIVEPVFLTETLKRLCELLTPLGDYRRSCAQVTHRAKRRKVTAAPSKSSEVPVKQEAVKTLEDLSICGINACTKVLEETVRSEAAAEGDTSGVSLLVVCKDDLTSNLLYQHFPALCALIHKLGRQIRLLALPKGAEVSLGLALGLPRVGCVALKKHAFTQSLIEDVVARVEVPTSSLVDQTGYKALNVKTIITSAPIVKKKVVDAKTKE